MPDLDDHQLLGEFVRCHSEAAFTELVRRYAGLVYSTARRFCDNPHHAEEITQAVFIILARKARTLSPRVVISGWLYQTARLTAANFVKGEIRRRRREQEASMQSTLNEPENAAWEKIAPLLDEAMGALGETDRNAVLLRYFENRTSSEIGGALRMTEETARKRVNRALEKLRHFFAKRGVTLSGTALSNSISANSVQPISPQIVKSLSAVALAKSTAASTSTLTLVKGALKIMALSNAKTAIIAGVLVLLAVAPAPIVVKEYEDHRTYSWELPPFPQASDEKLWKSPSQVRIVPSKYRHFMYGFAESGIRSFLAANGTVVQTNDSSWQSIGIGYTFDEIVQSAYDAPSWRIIYLTPIPKKPLYDYISNQHNLPHGTAQPLQKLIEKKFGIIAKWEPRETDVMVVKLANPDLQAFKPAGTLVRSMNITNIAPLEYAMGTARHVQQNNGNILGETWFNYSVDQFIGNLSLENTFNQPIINETGLTNRYDFTIKFPQWNRSWNGHPDVEKNAWQAAFSNQLGLELIPAKRTIPMLVVEKAP